MAMFVDFFVSRYLTKLTEFVESEACKVLGVKEDILKLQRRLHRIAAFLEDADQKHKNRTTGNWVRELKNVMYDADDIIDLCVFQGGKLLDHRPSGSGVPSPFSLLSSCFNCIKYRREIAGRIQALNARLKEITEDNSIPAQVNAAVVGAGYRDQEQQLGGGPSETSSMETASDEIVGQAIEIASQKLIRAIVGNEQDKCQLFGIVGMGGVGKTTLASKIFNDKEIKDKFTIRVWLHVSKNYTLNKLLKELIVGVQGKVDGGDTSRSHLENKLVPLLSKNLLVVLDDVWDAKVWEELKTSIVAGAARSRILVTTRDDMVAKKMGVVIEHHVQILDPLTSWNLLCKKVFREGEENISQELFPIGFQIVNKCAGLPLAIKVISGVLKTKEKTIVEWEQVLKSDVWSMSEDESELPRALHLSFEDLRSPILKQCFLYATLFPHSKCPHLVRAWVAEGFIADQGGDKLMEEVGEQYYYQLVRRNLLQPYPASVNKEVYFVHDLIRALGAKLLREEGVAIAHDQETSLDTLSKIRRLVISNVGKSVKLPRRVAKERCLRTLILVNSPLTNSIPDDVLEALRRVRVLDLSHTKIKYLPKSFGKLIHLRYLDLDDTKIRELPESIGNLANLQALNITRCKMRSLPMALTTLTSLRCLRARGARLTYFPKGMGRLTNLNCLTGFFVGRDKSAPAGVESCDLEELHSLAQLRTLKVKRLERAQSGDLALRDKKFLKELYLSWKLEQDDDDDEEEDDFDDETEVRWSEDQIERAEEEDDFDDETEVRWSEDQIERAEKVCDQLSPTSTLLKLTIKRFPGRRLPKALMSSESFPCLASLSLSYIPACTELPPLGLFPALKEVLIAGAEAITRIGPEFFGRREVMFPKLVLLVFKDMLNFEEWSTCGAGQGDLKSKLLPNLSVLQLNFCPTLKALPECLHHAPNLSGLLLMGTLGLEEVGNLPAVTELRAVDNLSLKRISNLPSLRVLQLMRCPGLTHVEGVDSLQALMMTYPPVQELVTAGTENQLPPWLPGLVDRLLRAPSPAFKRLEMVCSLPVLLSCLKDELNWPIIQQIPEVLIGSIDGSASIFYTKEPFNYSTNVAIP